MADDSFKTPGGDFRFLGTGEPGPRPSSPPGDAPADAPVSGGSDPAETAPAGTEQVASPAYGGAGLQAGIAAQLNGIEARAAERSEELTFELRNGLPGRIRREIHEQLRPMTERLANLERQNREPQNKGGSRTIAAAVIYAVLTGAIVAGVVMFDRPLRYWAQDNLYPLVGVGLPVAQRAPVGEKKAPPLGER